jgi:DNA-binding NtrC family response regulator
VVTVRLPPLRERGGDIAVLARHFLDAHCERHGKHVPGLRPDAVAALEAYPWPGNVRELDNELERIVIMADDSEQITLDMVSPHIIKGQLAHPPGNHSRENPLLDLPELSYDLAVERLERMLIERAMAAEGGSITKAARRIGIERSRLGKLRKRLGI